MMKYIKIAALLPEKTVRDVALRCRWMAVSSRSLYYQKLSWSLCLLFFGHYIVILLIISRSGINLVKQAHVYLS